MNDCEPESFREIALKTEILSVLASYESYKNLYKPTNFALMRTLYTLFLNELPLYVTC